MENCKNYAGDNNCNNGSDGDKGIRGFTGFWDFNIVASTIVILNFTATIRFGITFVAFLAFFESRSRLGFLATVGFGISNLPFTTSFVAFASGFNVLITSFARFSGSASRRICRGRFLASGGLRASLFATISFGVSDLVFVASFVAFAHRSYIFVAGLTRLGSTSGVGAGRARGR